MRIKAFALALWLAIRIYTWGYWDAVCLAVLRVAPVAAGLAAGAGLYWWMSR